MNDSEDVIPSNIEMNDVEAAFFGIVPSGNRVFYETYDEYPTNSSKGLIRSHFKGISSYKNQLIFTHTNLPYSGHSDSNPGKIIVANKQWGSDQASISAIYDTNRYHAGWSHPCSAQACGSFMAMGLQNTDDSSCFAEIHILDLSPLDNGSQPVSIGIINCVNQTNGQPQPFAVNGVAMTKEHGDNGKYIVAGVQGNSLTIYKSVNSLLDNTIDNNQFYVLGDTIQNFPRSGPGLALVTQTDGSIYLIALDTDDDEGSNNSIYLYKLTITDSGCTCSDEISSLKIPVPGLSEAVRYATGPALASIITQDFACGLFLFAFATGIQNRNILNTSFRWGKGVEIISPDHIKVYATDRNDLTTSRFRWPVDTQKDFSLVSWVTRNGGPSFIQTNQSLIVGATLEANNQQFFAVMQSDGNLCVYRGSPKNHGKYLWGSQATGDGGQFFTVIQSDGNLCTYYGSPGNQGHWLWGTQKLADGGNFFLIMQDDGNLCVYKGTSPSDNHGFVWGWM